MPLYAAAGIPVFWLINIEKKEIEVHTKPADDVYKNITLYRKGDTVSLPYADGASFDAGMLLGL